MAKSKDVIGEPGCIRVVFFDTKIRFVVKQSV